METNRDAALQWAEFALAEKRRGRRESASGPGSSLESTMAVRQFLANCIEEHAVSSILDLGCGDWNWMQHVLGGARAPELSYLGWDIHPGMIEELQRQHGTQRVRFQVADIVSEPLPAADLIICRDVLFHLETSMAAGLVAKILQSSARLFLSTTFPEQLHNTNIAAYLPINGWGFHRINLDIAPFSLGDRLLQRALEPNCSHQGKNRFVCLYRIGGPG